MSNKDAFKEMKAFKKVVMKELSEGVKEVAVDLTTKIQLKNPIKTGYSSSEWTIVQDSSNKPISAMDPASWKAFAALGVPSFFAKEVGELRDLASRMRLPVFYVQNNAYYINELEARTSMVLLSNTTVQQMLDDIALIVRETNVDLSSQ